MPSLNLIGFLVFTFVTSARVLSWVLYAGIPPIYFSQNGHSFFSKGKSVRAKEIKSARLGVISDFFVIGITIFVGTVTQSGGPLLFGSAYLFWRVFKTRKTVFIESEGKSISVVIERNVSKVSNAALRFMGPWYANSFVDDGCAG